MARYLNYDGLLRFKKNCDKEYINSSESPIAIGVDATATNSSSIAVGDNTIASSNYSIAIGYSTTASGASSIAVGNNTSSLASYSIAIGYSISNTTNATRSILLGCSINSSGSDGIAIGNSCSTSTYSVAIGYSSAASSASTVAIGINASANYSYCIAMGSNSTASSSSSIAIGGHSSATGVNSIAIGGNSQSSDNCVASTSYSIAIGYSAKVSGIYGTAIGCSSNASGASAIAIGMSANASYDGSVAIGANASTTQLDEIMIGGNGTTISFRNGNGLLFNHTIIGTHSAGSVFKMSFISTSSDYYLDTTDRYTLYDSLTAIFDMLAERMIGNVAYYNDGDNTDGTPATTNSTYYPCEYDTGTTRYIALNLSGYENYTFGGIQTSMITADAGNGVTPVIIWLYVSSSSSSYNIYWREIITKII